jgi:uncharacterized protein DUF3176
MAGIITPNAAFAFLVESTKVCMAATVEGALSQLRWLWFLHPGGRPLSDLQVYENAIHGPLSSVNLLRRLRVGFVLFLMFCFCKLIPGLANGIFSAGRLHGYAPYSVRHLCRRLLFHSKPSSSNHSFGQTMLSTIPR